MLDISQQISATVSAAMGQGGCAGREELARTEVRRLLDRAALGWSNRQAMLQLAETEIAKFRP
ncbi:MAG: hypothetical protein ACPGNV_18045 [Mangrovicoccus sp.]